MLKALLRKQLLEVRYFYLGGGRKNKKNMPKNPKGMYVLFIILYLVIMVSMFFASMGIGSALIPAGLDWLYFTVLNILAFLLGIIGSVMSTAQALFRSKDNELLLSMPIPPSRIVFVRMITVYLMSFVYASVVMIPAIIYYFIAGNVTFLSVVFCILSLFIMAFLITAFSCFAGWLVSLIATKLKNQKIVLVLLGVLLIGVIYYFQFNASRLIHSVVANAQEITGALKGWGYPLYAPGLGMSGHVVGFLVFLGIAAVLFGIAYYAVTKSFSRIALYKAAEKKTEFHNTDIRSSKLGDALFRREMKRFMASVSYMMNAGLGCLFLAAVGVLAIIKMQDIRMIITSIGAQFHYADSIAVVVGVTVAGLLAGLCLMASCSISMEGKYIWVYQSLPIDPYQIFRAKLAVHIILTGVPALFSILMFGIVLKASIPAFLCMIVFTGMYIVLSASFGLMLDLKKPKLNWTNENQALKSNVTVFVDMLLGMLVPCAICSVYLLLAPVMGPELYLVIWIAIFAVLTLLIHKWLAGRGRAIFSAL